MRPSLALAALAAACGSKPSSPTAPPPPRDAAALALAVDAAVPSDEPTVPPPPPTVKASTKGDCKTDYAPRPTRDPNPMCKIAGGTFVMGADDSDTSPAADGARPRRKVTLSPYYLDQFEVTVAQVAHFLNTNGNRCPSEKYGDCFGVKQSWPEPPIREVDGRFVVTPGYEHLAADWSNFEGAQRYCEWVGKRLPTEAEWEFAARHDPATNRDLRFPWGDRFDPARANCNEEACRDGFPRIAPVGSFDGTPPRGDGSSPWGVHDLAGNVTERVADCFVEPYPDCGECRDPRHTVATGEDCVDGQRGGAWGQHRDRMATYVRQFAASPGFRCAMSLR